jgi:hypothetical protein
MKEAVMRKRFIVLISILLITTTITSVSFVFGQGIETENIVNISFEPIDKYHSDNLTILNFNLKAKNTGVVPISNVTIKLQSNVASNYPEVHYFEIINSEETVVSPLEISYDATKEPPKLIWHIEYYVDGNMVEETVY